MRLIAGDPPALQSLVKVLEMVSAIVDSLAARGEGLSDQEALALLPTLVEKAGHNLDRVKAMHTALVRSGAWEWWGGSVPCMQCCRRWAQV